MLARAIAIALAFVAGSVYGFIGTVGHRASVDLLGLHLPWGLILAMVGVTGLILGLRLLLASRWAASAAALGVLATTWLLSLPRAGGSVLVADGVPGMVWAMAPTIIAVVIIGWPRLPPTTDRAA
jgi:hypothetical protein